MNRRALAVLLIVGVFGAAAPPAAAGRLKTRIYRISESASGAQANARSSIGLAHNPISDDARFVAFQSYATNLLATPDTNGASDVFVKDRLTGSVERISVSSSGAEANAASERPSMSGDGRFVVFASVATNLTPEGRDVVNPSPTDMRRHPIFSVYLRDRQAGTTTLISKTTDLLGRTYRVEGLAPSISDDGCTVAYIGPLKLDSDGWGDGVDVFDCATGTTKRVEPSYWGGPDISGDGRFITFARSVDADGPGGADPALRASVYSMANGTTEDVDVSSTGEPGRAEPGLRGWSYGPTISDDGRFVAFSSEATNLGGLDAGDPTHRTHAYVRDRATGTTTLASVTSDEVPVQISVPPTISGDGGSVVFDQATGEGMQLRRLTHGDTLPVSGGTGLGSISHDGRAVGFATSDVFLWTLLR